MEQTKRSNVIWYHVFQIALIIIVLIVMCLGERSFGKMEAMWLIGIFNGWIWGFHTKKDADVKELLDQGEELEKQQNSILKDMESRVKGIGG